MYIIHIGNAIYILYSPRPLFFKSESKIRSVHIAHKEESCLQGYYFRKQGVFMKNIYLFMLEPE